MAKDDDSREILRRVERDSESIMSSSMRRAADHFSGRDAEGHESQDEAEKWGRIAGRWLAILIAIGCVIYIVRTL